MSLALIDAVTGPFRYVPFLIMPVVAVAIIALMVYLLRRTSRKRG